MKYYKVIQTETAQRDAEDILDNMVRRAINPERGKAWYEDLDRAMNRYLTTFPCKFEVCHRSERTAKEYRKFVHETTVAIYTVDEEQGVVYIHLIAPKGKDWVSYLKQLEK